MQSWTMGIVMFLQTMGLIAFGHLFMSSKFADESAKNFMEGHADEMTKHVETAVFLQISNSSAILILSARTVGFFFSTLPCWQLMFTTALGQVIVNTWILCFAGKYINRMPIDDVLKVWAYDFACLLILD